jgi:transposase
MPGTVQLRSDYDAVALRGLAKRSIDPRQIRRLLALAAVYEGMSREDAARVGGMDRQTLRDWAHRFNADGPEGLSNHKGAGRPRLLTDEQLRELGEIVETGPDPVRDGVVRWRRADLVRVIEARFGVVCSERVITDFLSVLGFSHISARPRHPKQDAGVIEAFKKTSPTRSPRNWANGPNTRRSRSGGKTRHG